LQPAGKKFGLYLFTLRQEWQADGFVMRALWDARGSFGTAIPDELEPGMGQSDY